MTDASTNKTRERPSFYKLSAAQLPDDLFRKEATANDWIGWDEQEGTESKGTESKGTESDASPKDTRIRTCTQQQRPWIETTFHPEGFPPSSLGRVAPLDKLVDWERCIGIPMYMISNVSPLVIPLATLVWLVTGVEWPKQLAIFVAAYHGSLYVIWRLAFVPIFLRKYRRGSKLSHDLDPQDHHHSQYLFPERNVTKYCSMSYVWPHSLQRPALTDPSLPNRGRPVLFCLIPHGVVPYGVVGYPYFSKVWNSKLCSWTCAPALLKIPIVSYYLNAIGYVPAKSGPILQALTQDDRNVGIVLDGIDGMFHNSSSSSDTDHTETGAILQRKGICKIALKAQATIVPVYGFGHTGIYDLVVDPFGILQWLSSKLHLSLTPFFGRWGWFLGPPKRDVPITVCLGDPIYPPAAASAGSRDSNINNSSGITQEQIDGHHSKLLDGFAKIFETHKRGYYGETMGAKTKLVFVK